MWNILKHPGNITNWVTEKNNINHNVDKERSQHHERCTTLGHGCLFFLGIIFYINHSTSLCLLLFHFPTFFAAHVVFGSKRLPPLISSSTFFFRLWKVIFTLQVLSSAFHRLVAIWSSRLQWWRLEYIIKDGSMIMGRYLITVSVVTFGKRKWTMAMHSIDAHGRCLKTPIPEKTSGFQLRECFLSVIVRLWSSCLAVVLL